MSRRGKTSSHRRVVITGMGVLAPNGKTLTEFWDANVRGVSGIGRLSQEEAQAFGELLRERLAKFGLKISDKKSRIIEFGRHAWQRARRKGCRTPTFDFLGFTHYGDKTRKGTFKLGRKTSSRRMRLKLKAMNLWMKSVRNAAALEEWWPVLREAERAL